MKGKKPHQNNKDTNGNNTSHPKSNYREPKNDGSSNKTTVTGDGQKPSSERPEKPHVAVVGDSMTKLINSRKLSKTSKVTSHSFPGAVVEDFNDYLKPVLKRKPHKIIIHAGTNNLKRDCAKQIKDKMAKVIAGVKQENPNVSIAISSIIQRKKDQSLNDKITQVNDLVAKYCNDNNFDLIKHENIDESCLNAGGLHLNRKGIHILASNLRNYINY